MIKVCILTSVHPPFDIRIFHKEAKSLARAGYDVTLIAQHDKDDVAEGIRLVSLPKPKNRLERMTRTVWSVYRKALQVNADIYHFHDPELIPVGLLLRHRGRRVIYDVHEDYFESIKLKHWMPFYLRTLVAWIFKGFELVASKQFDAIITATETLKEIFASENCSAKWISNYPLIEQFAWTDNPRRIRKKKVCFVGGLSTVRAIKEMMLAAYLAKVTLIIAGRFETKALHDEMRSEKEWVVVEEKGYVDRKELKEIFSQSVAGFILHHSHPTAPYSQPNKLFEYMAAGLPVIASNYTVWKRIVEGNKCGICVDPLNIKEIANAIIYIINHPSEARGMGRRGQKAVAEKYNWSIEEKKLIQVYKDII
ncbi:MAG TPA: glycosyltransferase family 4 protein [Desulfatiglandales bacterium]|nr:glycosyltransferase family 4 protein [Desulfatiglandales bacterium]